MTQDTQTTVPEADFQTQVNDFTVTLLETCNDMGIGVVIPAAMNVVFNMTMSLRDHPKGGIDAARESITMIRAMVDHMAAQVEEAAEQVH